jgi:hypothetical protein
MCQGRENISETGCSPIASTFLLSFFFHLGFILIYTSVTEAIKFKQWTVAFKWPAYGKSWQSDWSACE